MKTRKWESQIWMLIIFSVTIIIATSIIGLLFFYYKKHLKEKVYISILWNMHVKLADLNDIWLCKTSSSAIIKYTPISDTYLLVCSDELWLDLSSVNLSKVDIISWCASSDTTCEYKIRK